MIRRTRMIGVRRPCRPKTLVESCPIRRHRAVSKTEIQAGIGRAPIRIRCTEGAKWKSPFTIRSNLVSPTFDAMVVVRRLAKVQRASRVGEATADKGRSPRSRRRLDRRVLADPFSGLRMMRVRTPQRQPIGCRGSRAKANQQGGEECKTHSPQHSSRVGRMRSFLLRIRRCRRGSIVQPLQPSQAILGHRVGDLNVDLIDTLKCLRIEYQVARRQRFFQLSQRSCSHNSRGNEIVLTTPGK